MALPTCVLSDALAMATMSVHEVWKLLSNFHCIHRPTGLLVRFSTATLNPWPDLQGQECPLFCSRA